MALPSDPNKLILTDADITRAGPLKTALTPASIGAVPDTRWRTGTGSPEGVVAAPAGTEYTDTAGTLGAWKWLKKTGTGATGWEVTQGDTGWIVPPAAAFSNGWVNLANPLTRFAYRRINGVVYFSGQVDGTGATGSQVLQIPAGLQPGGGASYQYSPVIVGNDVAGRLAMTTGGVVTITGTSTSRTLTVPPFAVPTTQSWPTSL